jgi:hypothetical protein
MISKILSISFLIVLSYFSSGKTPIVDGKEVMINGKKVIYSYKQFEKFDFDELSIEGEASSPNDLSISPGHERAFNNRLPYRKSFTLEIKKGIERVR